MINDVSKTINDENNGVQPPSVEKMEKATTSSSSMSYDRSGGDNGNSDLCVSKCIGDFPKKKQKCAASRSDKKHSYKNNKKYLGNKKMKQEAKFADASKMRKLKTMTTMPTMSPTVSCELTAMRGEKISPTNEATPTKLRLLDTKFETTSAATVTSKKSLHTSRKNKCPAFTAYEVSSHRATTVNTTSGSSVYGRNYRAPTTRVPSKYSHNWTQTSNQCERLESSDHKNTFPKSGLSFSSKAQNELSLAERKTKLRSDFFIQSPNESTKRQTENRLFNKVKTEFYAESVNARDASEINCKCKCLSTKCTCSKLKITKAPVEAPTTKVSLVEERKKKLYQKLEKPISSCRVEKQPLHYLCKVSNLVNKFEKSCQEMIVNPKKSLDEPPVQQQKQQQMYTLKPETQNQRLSSPLSDEGCNFGQSPCSTDDEHENEDNISLATGLDTKLKDKVARSASSDSALGLEVDEPMDPTTTAVRTASPTPSTPTIEQQQKRRMTLTVTDLPLRPALLPLAEPTTLPDSPTPELQTTLQTLISQTSVPSKVILEERVVEIPEDSLRSAPIQVPIPQSLANSRRESEQSCLSDYPFSDATPGIRYVRTPSVVVSDYSDDVMCGITLEEIEYFRAQRLNRRSSFDGIGTDRDNDTQSDISAASSCSNLNYCGSTISALDGAECLVNGRRLQLERKSCDDETTSQSLSEFTSTADNENKDIADLLAAQHISSKRAKKVGNKGNVLDLKDNTRGAF